MLNRRNFFKRLLQATAGATVAYSFPSIIVPKNLAETLAISNTPNYGFGVSGNVLTWEMMERAYNRIIADEREPRIAIVNKRTYEYFKSKGYC